MQYVIAYSIAHACVFTCVLDIVTLIDAVVSYDAIMTRGKLGAVSAATGLVIYTQTYY